MTADDQVWRQAAAVVEDYIVKSKGWKKNAFEVTFNRSEGGALVFWAVHSEDKTSKVPGGGKSVEVYVDPSSNKILKELAFQ